MRVSGTLTVNGQPGLSGATIAAAVGSADLVTGVLVANGSFDLLVPADDPETDAREGAREGEPIEFHAFGARATAPVSFRSGEEHGGIPLSLSLPDLVIVALGATPDDAREGENVTLSGAILNRGRIEATLVRVTVTEGASLLGSHFVGSLAPNATAGFGIVVGTVGMSGERSWRVRASTSNGEADPATDVALAGVRVEANEGPLVKDLRRMPFAPAAGEPIVLSLDAEDEDGIARVEFTWTVGSASTGALVTMPPYQVAIGPFAAGTSVRYHATVTDASPLARATTTPPQAFEVRGEPLLSPTATPTPEAASPTPETTDGVAWPGAGALAASLGVAYLLRRRT